VDLWRLYSDREGQEAPGAVEVSGLGGRSGQLGERPGAGAGVGAGAGQGLGVGGQPGCAVRVSGLGGRCGQLGERRRTILKKAPSVLSPTTAP